MTTPHDDPRFLACIELIRRSGAHSVEIRYQDDNQPVGWIAIATWKTNTDGIPQKNGPEIRHEAAGAMDPTTAMFRLCEYALDGGVCATCRRPAGVTWEYEPMPMREEICWWQYDSDHQKFIRGCGGDR